VYRQVNTISILLIVQGSLECAMGLLYAAMGPLMFGLMQTPSPSRSGGPPPPEEMAGIISGVYIVIGLFAIACGVLKIVAGIKNRKYRGRTLGYVALISGILMIFTCYCGITGIGLAIWGLIVYSNETTRRAFQLGEEGLSPDEIIATMEGGGYPPGGMGGPPPPGGFGGPAAPYTPDSNPYAPPKA
jgi:hypothetical protein